MMKKIFAAVISATVTALMLTGCGANTAKENINLSGADTEYYSALKDEGVSINVANWGEYISDGTDDGVDIISEFEKLTGISVNYTTYATNEELYAKMKAGAADYDIIIPSDYMISKMINEDMLDKLDYSNIPNYANVDEKYKNTEFDPGNEYSVPYFWGTVGIIYNKNLVSETDFGWEILWDEKYADRILMFDNPRDAFAIAENMLGFSLNTENAGELNAAAQKLKEQKPLVQAYVMDEIFDKMGAEEAAVAPYYAGDAVTLMADYDFLGFKLPESGTNMFIDSVCIPKGAAEKKAAEMFINFLLEPEVGLCNSEYVGYSSPNTKTFDMIDESVKNDSISYLGDDYLSAHTETFKSLSAGGDKLMSDLWTQIRSAE